MVSVNSRPILINAIAQFRLEYDKVNNMIGSPSFVLGVFVVAHWNVFAGRFV